MSSVYVSEPSTTGKVVLKTSFGDVDIELWSREAPLACRNFVQLCLEGAYDGTAFHRVIPGFMVQGGDPEGTGRGGESIYGRPFKDEFHSRLKFSRRGIVAMANENEPNTNRQQFFITLDKAAHLNGKHTIFGRVNGPTVFNVLRIGELETDEHDRPAERVTIDGAEVLSCPFDDIRPRQRAAARKRPQQEEEQEAAAAEAAAKQQRKRRRRVKDRKLLSFGDEEEDVPAPPAAAARPPAAAGPAAAAGPPAGPEGPPPAPAPAPKAPKGADAAEIAAPPEEIAAGADSGAERREEASSAAAAAAEEYRRLQAELLQARKAAGAPRSAKRPLARVEGASAAAAARKVPAAPEDELLTEVEKRRRKYRARSALKLEEREDSTLQALAAFTSSMRSRRAAAGGGGASESMFGRETYAGQVLEAEDGAAGDDGDWFVGKLKFRKHVDDAYRRSEPSVDDYVTIDGKGDR